MAEWLKALLSSKRTQAVLIGLIAPLIVTLGNQKFGLNLTEEQVTKVITTILTAVGIFSVSDSIRMIGVSHDEAQQITAQKMAAKNAELIRRYNQQA